MSEVLEKAVKQLNDALEVIEQETNLISFDIASGPYSSMEYKDIHLNKEDFSRLFGSKIACVESRKNEDYPYQKYVIIGGLKFYCLLESLEECA